MKNSSIAPENFLKCRRVNLIDRYEMAAIEYSPVIEHTRERFGLFTRCYVDKMCGDLLFCAEFLELFYTLWDKRTLIVVVDGQIRRVNGL